MPEQAELYYVCMCAVWLRLGRNVSRVLILCRESVAVLNVQRIVGVGRVEAPAGRAIFQDVMMCERSLSEGLSVRQIDFELLLIQYVYRVRAGNGSVSGPREAPVVEGIEYQNFYKHDVSPWEAFPLLRWRKAKDHCRRRLKVA